MRYFVIGLALCSISALAQPPVVPGLSDTNDLGPRLNGSVLVSELSCNACHAADGAPAPKRGPVLDGVAGRVQHDYLRAFIADPATVKPGTTMPGVLGGLAEADRDAAARAIADYLASLTDARPELDAIDGRAVKRGTELFHRVGCVACHAPEDKAIPGSVPLHRLADKYSVTSLTAFLEDPLSVRPAGRMPDMGLDHFEASDIANYLLREQEAVTAAPAKGTLAAAGRVLFRKHGCAQCHSPGEPRAGFAPPLAELDAGSPCSTARYPLDERQRASIAAAAQQNPRGNLAPFDSGEIEIALTTTRLNCVACHERDGRGGVAAARDMYFTTSNLNLGEQARIPPSLSGVGAKLDGDWLRKVLLGGQAVRPYMHTRMPVFGEANVGHLLAALPERDKLEPAEFERVADAKAARTAGFELVGTKNLSCVACHTWKGESSTTLKGLELTSMASRLQENWFHHYMRNPQQFHPTTIMPNFWPAGKAVRPEVLDGDPGMQIDAIWQYLSRGREARTPHGIKREPIEYGPRGGEAVLLRRQYRGIGKRGIGVGYPSGINIAFDALQLRLGSIWAGDFGEMSGVWRGQGSGSVNERSRDVVRFPPGPAIVSLPAPGAPWPRLPEQTRPEGYRFKGYSLDAQQRPTFRYTVGALAITDRFVDNDGALTRTLTFDPPAPEGLYLLLGAARRVAPAEGESAFELDRGLTVQAPAGAYLFESTELRLPLHGKAEATINYSFKR